MRGTFVIVVAAGIAAAVGISALRGRDSSSGPDSESRRWSDPSDAPSDEGPLRDPAPVVAPEAGSLGASIDARLVAGDIDGAAKILAGAETKSFGDAALRQRALRVADGLVTSAESLPTRAGIDARIAARRIVAAIYDHDASTRSDRDEAFKRSQALFEILVRGNGAPPELAARHKVAQGENVWNLARGPWKAAGCTVPPGFVLWVNGVADARRLRVGQTLKVPLEPLAVVVRKSAFDLTVTLGGAPIERFSVAVGADAKTPVGTFAASDCLRNPDWYMNGRRIPFGSKDHIIGTRWIGLSGGSGSDGIGIHGTNDESSIGKPVSMGCIRMRNADVERLFEWLGTGTRVEIRD